jgi:hypothetical protein
VARCNLCGVEAVVDLLDFGMQPPSNRFLRAPTDEERAYPMVVGQCSSCGLVQLSSLMPVHEMRPRYEWITYSEPEGHLDDLVEIISRLPGVTRESAICGISHQEDSTLKRLNKKGFLRTWRIDPKDDLEIEDPNAGIETIQGLLTPGAVERLVRKHGSPDVVIARSILEHAHDTLQFLTAVKHLIRLDGYVIFEVPCCERIFETFDYSSIWEEHVLYFTRETFRFCFSVGGFSLFLLEIFPYPIGNSLVGIARAHKTHETVRFPSPDVLAQEKRRMQLYANKWEERRAQYVKVLAEYQRSRGKIALFGAGHLAASFINLLGLKTFIDFVVDDHPAKRGLFMPGSRLPIRGSASLNEGDVKLCLMSLNPESEERVMSKNQSFVNRGGAFASIFPASKHALQI